MFIEKIENILIGISRYFLIIIGALSLIGAGFVLLYSLSMIADSPDAISDEVAQPNYVNYKSSLFPKKKFTPKPSLKSPSTISENNNSTQRIAINPKFLVLRDSILYQFNDSQEMVDTFSSNITPRSLQEFISDQYLRPLNQNQGQKSLDMLIIFFNEIKDIKDFKKVGDFDARLDLVTQTIKLFYLDYYEGIENRKLQQDQAIRDANTNNILGYTYLQYVLYALAIYALAVLYLMIFKVEIDLRRIPSAIKDEKD
jgi:hypothetical protein